MFLNTSLVEDRPTRSDIEVVEVPANQLAKELLSERSANMVMLGALSHKTGIVSPQAVRQAISQIFDKKKKAKDSNHKAFNRGVEFISKAGGG